MRKNNQIITIVALVIAVVALGIGFAAFSSTLTIKTEASVNPSSSEFKVVFSSSSSSVVTGDLKPISTYDKGATATLNETTITQIEAQFTEPGQQTVYQFWIHNTGKYDAWLNSVVFENVSGQSVKKICEVDDSVPAEEQADPKLVEDACEGISLYFISDGFIGELALTDDKIYTDRVLAAETVDTGSVTLWIEYAYNAVRADGPFTVTFGDVKFNFSSVNS